MKNLINAVPSFRSEVDLQGVSRKSSPFGDSIERDEISLNSMDTKDEISLDTTDSNHKRISKIDASTQVTLESDYYEEINFTSNVNVCEKTNCCERPDLPKKTFDSMSTFGCEVNTSNKPLTNNYKTLLLNKSHSLPLNKKRNTNQKVIDSCDQTFSSDLNALLSPQHKQNFILKAKAESLIRGLSDGSVSSTATVIEFINTFTDLETQMNSTDGQHLKNSSVKTSDSLIDISLDDTSDDGITVKSMPSRWRYSSSSVDSFSDSLNSSKLNESFSSPNATMQVKSNKTNSCTGATNDLYSSPSEQSLSSMSSSSTLSYAPTIGSSSSTPTPITPKPYKESGIPPKHSTHTHPLPKPRSKNRAPNTGSLVKESNKPFISTDIFANSGSLVLNQMKRNNLMADDTRVAQIMEQLEVAIAYGQHKRAAVLAKELAIRKVACTLNRSGIPNNNTNSPIIAYLYIEDRHTHKGPIPFQVYPSMSVNMLKLKVEKEFSIPSDMQKWILGKTLATNLSASLATYGITCSGCPIFLYLLPEEPKHAIIADNPQNNIMPQNEEWFPNEIPAPILDNNLQPLEPLLIPETSDTIHAFDLHSDTNVIPEEVDTEKPQTYLELVQLDDVKCVTNTEPFECPVCFVDIGVGEGIVLRDCLHSFCRFCLLNAIQYNTEVEVKCPFRNNDYSCDSRLQDREVKEVVPLDVYERYLQKSISTAESKIEKSFHCKTVDCCGWCEFDDKVNVFRCPVCGHENCINCQAIHETMNCKQYQDQLDFNAAQNEDAMKTKELIDNMLLRDEALRCPQCQVVLLKKWGCDWVKCSMCETEICWVTKGFRWGPKGRGDTSGGCRCNVKGVRCHPNCKYCH